MHNSPYVSNSFLNQFAEIVLSYKGDLSELCAMAGLSEEAVVGGHQLIPFENFIRLLEVAEDVLSCPDIALQLAQRQDVSILGPLSLLLSDCKNFSEVLDKTQEYFKLIVSGVTMSFVESRGLFEIHYDVDLPGLFYRAQFQNYLLASTVVAMWGVAGWKYPLRGCFFVREEPDLSLQKKHAQFFGCPVAFGTNKLKIIFDEKILQEPSQAVGNNLSKRYSGAYREDIVKQVVQIIGLSLSSGKADLNSVSCALGVSARTLHRRLEQSSTSFNALLASTRLSLANQYLSSSYYSLADIAALLGYANLSAFTRSYKNWCGMTPSTLRKSLK